MTGKALYVRLEAKPGKEAEVAAFLQAGAELVKQEPGTITWFAIQMSATSFAIFDTFDDDSGRDAHLSGAVAAALMEKAPDLFGIAPTIDKIDILATKLR